MTTERTRSDDDGLSLIELVIYIVVLGIIMSGVIMIFVNTWRAQAAVTSQTEATSKGQLAASEIEKAMRNAIDFTVTDDTLLVNTSFTGDHKCQGFYVDSSGLHMALRAPSAGAATGWPVWQQAVARVGGLPVFAALGSENGISYQFNATNESGATRFSGVAYMRNATRGGATDEGMGGC